MTDEHDILASKLRRIKVVDWGRGKKRGLAAISRHEGWGRRLERGLQGRESKQSTSEQTKHEQTKHKQTKPEAAKKGSK